MFSGIVEAQGRVLDARQDRGLILIDVEKPAAFDDLKIGDSVCTSGVCLTVEQFNDHSITFALGHETLQITGWLPQTLQSRQLNLERSLRMGDRIHGHMVSGHVDGVGLVKDVKDLGGSVQIDIQTPERCLPFMWKKGSWSVNGVSLTINTVEGDIVSSCLIPETLRRTNLGSLQIGDKVNLEIDMMARGLVAVLRKGENNESNL